MNKFSKLALSTVVAIMPFTTMAQDAAQAFSGNVTLTSDYVLRGQSQTENNPAIQGGFDYNHESGLYLGTWASNVSFADGLEIDGYGGFAGELANGLGWDVKGIYYAYPATDSGEDYMEFGPSLNYTFGGDFEPTVTVGVLYSDDYQFNTGEAYWVYSDLDLTLPNEFGLGFHVGNQSVKNELVWGTPDWLEYNVSLSKTLGPLDFSVQYIDTDLNATECYGGANICDEQVVFSVSGGF
jgi:uncharacterized protein (TIGR02001 family)